jgi:hypothetical protein
MDGKMARARRWTCEKFQHNSVSKRLVKKRGEEGFYLYPKKQSEGTWMNSKCHSPVIARFVGKGQGL